MFLFYPGFSLHYIFQNVTWLTATQKSSIQWWWYSRWSQIKQAQHSDSAQALCSTNVNQDHSCFQYSPSNHHTENNKKEQAFIVQDSILLPMLPPQLLPLWAQSTHTDRTSIPLSLPSLQWYTSARLSYHVTQSHLIQHTMVLLVQ